LLMDIGHGIISPKYGWWSGHNHRALPYVKVAT